MRMTPEMALRHFMFLGFVRRIPVGLWLSAGVLLLLARGHSLAAAGAIFALHALVVGVLELPTGGLADVLGRRPVLMAASAFCAVGLTMSALAQPLWQFALAAVLQGTGMALASGALDAWYVDTVQATDGKADLRYGLSLGSAAAWAGLGVGALLGGLTAFAASHSTSSSSRDSWLSAPILLAAALWVVHGFVVARRLDEVVVRGRRVGVLRNARRTMRVGLQLARCNVVMRRLLLSAGLMAGAAYAVETLVPIQLHERTLDADRAPLIYGLLLAVSYVAGAVGSANARGVAVWADSTAGATAVGLIACGCGVAAFVPSAGVLLFAVGFVTYQAALGVVEAMQAALVHEQVTARYRATAASVFSLSTQSLGAAGGFLLAFLAHNVGLGAAWMAMAAIFFLAALPMRDLLRRTRIVEST